MPKLTDYNYCMLNTAALYAKKKFPNKNLSSKGKNGSAELCSIGKDVSSDS
jgi:hypothetical protein